MCTSHPSFLLSPSFFLLPPSSLLPPSFFLLPPSRYYEASDRARKFGAPANTANTANAANAANASGASQGRRSPSGRALNDIGGDHASPAEIVLDAADKIRFDAVEEMKGRGKKSDDIAVIVVTMNRFWESEMAEDLFASRT